MGKIYVGQSSLRIQVTTNVNIADAITKQIKYQKPDGTISAWDATSIDDINGCIYYDVLLTTEIDVSGPWVFWAYIVFSDGRLAPGEPFTKTIYPVGS